MVHINIGPSSASESCGFMLHAPRVSSRPTFVLFGRKENTGVHTHPGTHKCLRSSHTSRVGVVVKPTDWQNLPFSSCTEKLAVEYK